MTSEIPQTFYCPRAVLRRCFVRCRRPGRCRADDGVAHTFRVFVRGVDTGIEEVTVLESADGWTLRGSGKLRAPVNLAMDFWEARYDRAWKPIELTINLTESAKQWTVHTTFSGTIASSDITQDGQIQRRTQHGRRRHRRAAEPHLRRVRSARRAARDGESRARSCRCSSRRRMRCPRTIHNVTDETIKMPGRIDRGAALDAAPGRRLARSSRWRCGPKAAACCASTFRRRCSACCATTSRACRRGSSPWRGRMTRKSAIPANGFSLAATISRPVAAAEPAPAPGRKPAPVRLPAVVLVSGSGPTDRDEFVAGIPIFAQLANALADAGYLVVRYDERGAGQSGGRQESATIEEFAVDARAVVAYLLKRRDVDPKRISLIGYGEGGWIALLVAAREQKIAAIGLIATPSTPGTELVLEQQRLLFERRLDQPGRAAGGRSSSRRRFSKRSSPARAGRTSTPDMRKRVDTPLYRSFLMFDPAQVIVKVRQPMLVVQPMLDREVPAYHGEQLAQLARSRPRARRDRFRPAGRRQSSARAGGHRRDRRVRNARAAQHQPGRDARADVVAHESAVRRARRNRCGFWKPTTRRPTA